MKVQRSTMLFQRASRMFAAVVLVVIAVIDSTQSAVLRKPIEKRIQPQEEVSENEVNNSLPVLCLRKIFGGGDCVDKLTVAARGDPLQICKPDQVLVKGKCSREYDDSFLFPTSEEEEKTVDLEEKLPTICDPGSELIGDTCVVKLTTETRDNTTEKCKSGEVLVHGVCFSLDEIASPESSEENDDNAKKLPTVCLRGFDLFGGKCINKFGSGGAESNSSESEDDSENEEIVKTLNELFKTVESRQSGGQTPANCLRGHVLIGEKCVDFFSLGSGINIKEDLTSKDIPSMTSLSADVAEASLPVICSRTSELIDGKCEDHFEPEVLKMGCPINYVKIGDKCIHRDFDQDSIVFPSELCEKDSTWNGEKCVEIKKVPQNVNRIQT